MCTDTGGLLIRVGSTYGVGGFAMIEARDNGESSMAGGADTDTRLVVGPVGGGDRYAEGAGVAEVGAERGARFSPFETARGIGTGWEEGNVDCTLYPSPELARVIGAGAGGGAGALVGVAYSL